MPLELDGTTVVLGGVDVREGRALTREGEVGREFMIILDGTAVVFGSGLGNGEVHSHSNIALMVGGHFGGWQHGRYHQFNNRNHADVIDTMRQKIGLADNYGLNQVPTS